MLALRRGLHSALQRCTPNRLFSSAASEVPLVNIDHIKVVGVIGAGQMGSGIAQVAASANRDVVLRDISQDVVDRGKQSISSSLARLVKKGVYSTDQADEILARIRTTTFLEDMSGADIVIEACPEAESLKKEIFSSLDKITPPHTILASNTSSISITRLANATSRPDKVIGMHFMNPVPLMKLVELIRGMGTSPETLQVTEALSRELGKTTCLSQDRPGFIVNRVLMPMINEAFYALMEGVGSPEDIDTGMKLGSNQPMGPLTLADFIGLDTCLAIMKVLHDGMGDSKYRPCPLLVSYVDAGWLGRKTGRGVYEYAPK